MADPIAVNPNALSNTIEFLTAMVTPTLLISATGSLVLSTSTRLGRVVDRVRELESRLSDLILTEDKDSIPLYEKRIDTVVNLLDKVTSRARILQRDVYGWFRRVRRATYELSDRARADLDRFAAAGALPDLPAPVWRPAASGAAGR